MQHIYLIKNSKTGRIYVGRTQNPKRRIKWHLNALKGGYHPNELMQEDFNLYGEDTFQSEVVQSFENSKRKGIEGNWILKLKTYDGQFGYNYKDPYAWCKYGYSTRHVVNRLEQRRNIQVTGEKLFQKKRKPESILTNNIKRIAKEKDIPIYKIEDDCGYQRGAISKWKTSSPTASRLKVVADYLKTTVDELLKE